MTIQDVYVQAYQQSASKKPDREGLYTMLQAYVRSAPKRKGLTAVDVESLLLSYDRKLRDFCAEVNVEYLPTGFKVTPSSRTNPTYLELLYGSSWYDGDADVASLVIEKIFWGKGS